MEARQIWEQAIAAKGGRERLQAVLNMVISTQTDHIRREEVCVFPDKFWSWDDYRPSVLGLTVEMYDYGRGKSYMVTNGQQNEPPAITKDSLGRKSLIINQLDYLLETQWLKPTPISSTSAQIGSHKVDVVQTTVENQRVDFAFDQKTHLLVNVKYYDIPREHTFWEYDEIDGLKMPTAVQYSGGPKYKAAIKLNVDYDQSIFLKPPAIRAGPLVWKLK